MKNTRKIFLLSLLLFLVSGFTKTNAQCNITASGYPLEICAGEPVILSSSGACGYLLNNDYNNGTVGIGWASNANPMFNNPCGPGLDGTIHCWIGSATNFPRHLTTDTFDVSVGGCQIHFEMKYGDQQTAQDCEDPDALNEGVHLQYSIDYGNTWTDINYWAPTTNISGPLYVWNQYQESIPAVATTNHTTFRWWQSLTSGNTWDHWGLDNCQIFCLASQNVQWSHGPSVFNPPPVYPVSDTMYAVTITDTVNNQYASDTVWITVHPIPTADFTVSKATLCDYDSIVVTYTGTATATANYSWDFEGGVAIPGTGPGPHTVTWSSNGKKTISLSVTEHSCNSSPYSDSVTVYPSPLVSIIPSIIEGCEPLHVDFLDNTSPALVIWNWDFGDGATSNQQNPSHTYQNAGTYSVSLSGETQYGCTSMFSAPGLIKVHEQPIAGFEPQPPIATIQEPDVTFIDQSVKAANYYWDFGDDFGGTSTQSQPTYTYQEIGDYTVMQVVYTDFGCADTAYYNVKVIDDVLTFPNVITPNNDGKNDFFVIDNLENYISNTIVIYNRWGKKVFEQDNYQNDWDGEGLADGVYFYVVEFHGYLRDGTEEGSLTIIR